MRQTWKLLFWFFLMTTLAACQVITPFTRATDLPSGETVHSPADFTPTAENWPGAPAPAQITPTLPESSNILPPPVYLPPQLPSARLPSLVSSDGGANFTLRVHPEGPLYVGDQVSLEVIAPPNRDLEGKDLLVQLKTAQGLTQLAQTKFAPFGLGRRLQATLWWVWDTKTHSPGDYELVFSLPSQGLIWSETLTLHPSNEQPVADRAANWASANSDCCTIHYITGTAAERDLELIREVVDEQARIVSHKFGLQPQEKIPVVLLPRVLGHGGFASDEIAVSYLDRNYAGGGFAMIVHHEMVHWFDGRLKGDLKPSLFVEGLAVYLSGGHFKPEALLTRASALLPPREGCKKAVDAQGALLPGGLGSQAPACGLDWFIPLAQLAENFYPSQHEIGYLEAGALVEYMVNRWGWSAFSDFYRDIHPIKAGDDGQSEHGSAATVSAAINAALIDHFSISLAQLEQDFIASLKDQSLKPESVADVHLSVLFFDRLRQYQALLDPSAYYLYAWLADSVEMRKRGITADYLRRHVTPYHLALELMFLNADEALRTGDYPKAATILGEIGIVLEKWPEEGEKAFGASSLAADILALVNMVRLNGYEPQKIEFDDHIARVWGSTTGPDLFELAFVRNETGWQILPVTGLTDEISLRIRLWAGV